jgi:hypothetical protein
MSEPSVSNPEKAKFMQRMKHSFSFREAGEKNNPAAATFNPYWRIDGFPVE